MFKNTASQKLIVFAFDATTNLPKSGDAANLTAYISKDYGAVTVLGDTSATEMDATNAKGYYLFDLTQAETNADTLLFSAKSSTSNIVVVGAPAYIQTVPSAFGIAGGASGGLLIAGTNSAATLFTGGMTISNSGGSALTLSSSGSNGHGLTASGNGSGHGFNLTGGATGNGLRATGGATSGDGVIFQSNSGASSGTGLKCLGLSTAAIYATCHGSASIPAMRLDGGGGSPGLTIVGDAGQVGAATAGLSVAGYGAAAGILSTGGSTGPGASFVGGSTSGSGISISVTSGHCITGTAVGSGNSGLNFVGGVNGHGASFTGGAAVTTTAAGHGVRVTGGAASTSAGGTAGLGATFVGGAGAASTNGAAVGVSMTGGGTNTVASAAHGLSLTATSTGFDFNLAASKATLPQVARINTATAGGASTVTLDASASATDSFYKDTVLAIIGGTGAGQCRRYSSYVGGTKVYTVDSAWATNPDNTSVFAVLYAGGAGGGSVPTAAEIATAVWQDATAGDFTVSGSIGKSLFTSGAVPGAAGGLFIAGTNAATTVTTAFTTTFTGDVSGSVGSVTGSVGSVATGGITAASIADGAIDRATFAADTGLQTVRSGAAQAGGSATVTLDASASAVNDFYVGLYVRLTGGAGAGQVRLVTDYDGTTKAATVATDWTTNPDNTSTFALVGSGQVDVRLWANGTVILTPNSALPRVAVAALYDSDTDYEKTVSWEASGAWDPYHTKSLAADTITAASIAANAITDAKVASDVTIASVTGAVGSVTATVSADVVSLSGDATAADNAEAFFDGTGYAGTNNVIPTVTTLTGHTPQTGDNYARLGAPAGASVSADIAAVQAGVSGIGTAGGAAISIDPATDNASGGISGVTSGTTKVGTQTGTFANVSNVDASYHTITHAGNAIDWVYQFLTGGGTSPVAVRWVGYLTSANDTISFYAWNHVGGAWELLGTQIGQAGTTNVTKTITLYARHRGTSSAELGKVYVRLACTAMTSPVLNTDQLVVGYSVTSRSVGYADGAVWIDTTSGTAGTESFVNGTADLPSLTLADALTIAAAVGIRRFWVLNGSSITLTSSMTNRTFLGKNWTLALGGQAVAGCLFDGATVSGTCTGTTPIFENCIIGAVTLPPSLLHLCALTDTITVGSAGNYRFHDCVSGVAGSGTPAVDFGAVGATNMEFRRWSGGLTLSNLASGDVVSVDAVSGGTVTLNGADATVGVRGMVNVTNNLTGSPTVTTTNCMDSRFDTVDTNIGTAGAGLTALGDTRIANLDATISSRMATYTQPTGFLAATFPTTVASTTNITAGTITTTTNLTNLPTIPANWLTAAGTAADFTTEIQTGIATAASIAALNNLSAAQVNAEVDTALADVGLTTTVTGRIDVASSTLATAANLSTLTGYVDTEVAAIKAKTDLIPAAPAAVGDIPTAAQNATAWGSSVVGNSRTRDMYLQGLTNKISFAADGLTYTIYAADDTTALFTGAATRLATDVGGLRSVDPT